MGRKGLEMEGSGRFSNTEVLSLQYRKFLLIFPHRCIREDTEGKNLEKFSTKKINIF
jgi:hypothetical protein